MPRVGPTGNARADWLAARALIASRRLRPYVPLALLTSALVFGAVYAIRGPWAHWAAEGQRTTALAAARERDTLPLREAFEAATAELARRDSMLRNQRSVVDTQGRLSTISPNLSQERDSLRRILEQLDVARTRAAKAPLSASYRELAATKALRTLPAAQLLADTLNLLDRARAQLDPVAAPQSEFARLSQRVNAIGGSLQVLASVRRALLLRQIEAVEARGRPATDTAPGVDTMAAHNARETARVQVLRADSILRVTRQWQTTLQHQADSAALDRASRILGASPFLAAFGGILLVCAGTFAATVWREVRRPTVAHAREVERLAGVPVLVTVRQFRAPREGRERLAPGAAIDPFRRVYLSLTASGTRERSICVASDDVASAAVVAARIAITAATDKDATLVVDLAPGVPGVAAHFGLRDEPGFTEAIAGIRLWREASCPIGASEGLAFDVVPSGAPRPDVDESVQSTAARSEFTRFAGEYDLAVLCAPTETAVRRGTTLLPTVATILIAHLARTELQSMCDQIDRYRTAGVRVNGIILLEYADNVAIMR